MNKIDEIYKNLNSINGLNSEESIKDILLNTSNEIVDYIKCDGFSIYLYDEKNSYLNPYICLGDYKKIIDLKDKIYIDEKLVNRIVYNNVIEEGILDIKKFSSDTNIKNYLKYTNEKIQYLGIYKMIVDQKLIGLLAIGYINKPCDKDISNEFIKFLSKMMGVIINSSKINETLKSVSEKCKKVENELDDYLDISADLFVVFDVKGNQLKTSGTYECVLGWSLDELQKNGYSYYIHPEDLLVVDDAKKYLVKNGVVKNNRHQVTIRYLTKDNTYKWIRWRIKYSSNLDVFISTGKDITKEIREEEKSKNLEEVIKLETMKNEFFSNVSHEFKTPLNIILGTMQIMDKKACENDISNENIFRYISSIRQNSYRLLRLVNNLIDISKMDVGCYNIVLSNNNIVSIIEDITMSVIQYVENNNIELIFDTDVEEIITACDPNAIERVMLNLLSNAIKYMPPCGGKIEVFIKAKKDNVVVLVRDNGVGIPKEKLDIIFNRFGQANTDLTRANEGSGIGLSLVQSIIEYHGGSIRVESEIKKGSTFIFEIPIKILKEDKIELKNNNNDMNEHIEKCNVEFSDIYNL